MSRFGVADMIGNLWEWTDRNGEQAGTNTVEFGQGLLQTPTGVNGVSDGTWNLNGSAYGYTGSSYGWQNGSPSAAFRGGAWGDSAYGGVFALVLNHSGSYSGWHIGFRCARPR
jgi:formylglycine-generating enzyme required for sulfatase activity